MKSIKTIILLILFSFSFQINAQNAEKQAKKISDAISETLSLSKEESAAVYKIQLSKFKEGNEIKKEYEDDEETKKEKLNELGNRIFNEMKTLLGKERMKTWNEHKSKKNN